MLSRCVMKLENLTSVWQLILSCMSLTQTAKWKLHVPISVFRLQLMSLAGSVRNLSEIQKNVQVQCAFRYQRIRYQIIHLIWIFTIQNLQYLFCRFVSWVGEKAPFISGKQINGTGLPASRWLEHKMEDGRVSSNKASSILRKILFYLRLQCGPCLLINQMTWLIPYLKWFGPELCWILNV